MYTELILKCEIKRDISPEIWDILNYLFNDAEEPKTLPDHPFFTMPRWRSIGREGSYYHHPEHVNSFIDTYLFSRSDLKNYDDEIEKFLEWLTPYINEVSGKCIGWYWHETAEKPTLLHLGNKISFNLGF